MKTCGMSSSAGTLMFDDYLRFPKKPEGPPSWAEGLMGLMNSQIKLITSVSPLSLIMSLSNTNTALKTHSDS